MPKNLSRREWLKLAGAGIAGLALFPGEEIDESEDKSLLASLPPLRPPWPIPREPTAQEWERAIEGVSLRDGPIVPVQDMVATAPEGFFPRQGDIVYVDDEGDLSLKPTSHLCGVVVEVSGNTAVIDCVIAGSAKWR